IPAHAGRAPAAAIAAAEGSGGLAARAPGWGTVPANRDPAAAEDPAGTHAAGARAAGAGLPAHGPDNGDPTPTAHAANTATTRAATTTPPPGARRRNPLIDSTHPACGTATRRGGRKANLWTAGPPCGQLRAR